MKKEITQELVKEFLDYNPETGVFTWKERDIKYFKESKKGGIKNFTPEWSQKKWNTRYAGQVAGCEKPDGYRIINIFKQRNYAHRLAWLYIYGEWPKQDIDHIDGNPRNNRISNLRDISRSLNGQNQKKAQKRSKSGLLGACWCPRDEVWVSQIFADGRRHFLGNFQDKYSAHEAYIQAKRRLHPGGTL